MTMNRKVELVTVEVDNPLFTADHAEGPGNPKKTKVTVNARESAIVSLSVRGFLKPHQEAAAGRFRRVWETSSGLRRKQTFEHVDVRTVLSISDEVVDASRELQRCREQLGLRNYMLLVAVCGYGRALSEMFPVKRARLTAADNLRNSLDELAWIWGFYHKAH
jgi:hypothetical protein